VTIILTTSVLYVFLLEPPQLLEVKFPLVINLQLCCLKIHLKQFFLKFSFLFVPILRLNVSFWVCFQPDGIGFCILSAFGLCEF